jgi:hypothetical protein
VLRLLTLICFFHFSGLNNGYTYLTEISPLNPTQSVLVVRFAFAGINQLFSIEGIASCVNRGCGFFTGLIVNMERKTKGQRIEVRSQKLKGTGRSQKRGYRLLTKNIGHLLASSSFQQKQADYVNEQKEVWLKQENINRRSSAGHSFKSDKNRVFIEQENSGKISQWLRRNIRTLKKVLVQRIFYHTSPPENSDLDIQTHREKIKGYPEPNIGSGFFIPPCGFYD